MICLAKLHNAEIAFRFNPNGDPVNGYYIFKKMEKGTIKKITKLKVTASQWPIFYAGTFEYEFDNLPTYYFRSYKNGKNKFNI